MLPEILQIELERLYLKNNIRYVSEKIKFWEDIGCGRVCFCGEWTEQQRIAAWELDYLEENFPDYFKSEIL